MDEYICSGWCCTDCLILLANGDTPDSMDEAKTAEWLAQINDRNKGYEITLGMLAEDHADGCPVRDGNRDTECDCEQQTFSWSPCDVCGSNLGGARDAVSFWKITS